MKWLLVIVALLCVTACDDEAAQGAPEMKMRPLYKTSQTIEEFQHGGCIPAGCSKQLCVDAKEAATAVSTCEFRASYACYKTDSVCERQENEQCGWTDSPALQACLKTNG